MTGDALSRMPHKGAMLLLASVEAMDAETIRCKARNHCGADYPLRVEGDLMTLSLVELGAQAAAAHASMHGIGGAHTGLLLSLRKVTAKTLTVADSPPLTVEATRVTSGPMGACYTFRVLDGTAELLTGEAILSMEAR